MRDIEDLLQQTTPGDVRPPDLDALHRRGVHRRWTVRLGSAGTVVAVAAVGALSLQSVATPIIDGDEPGPAAGRDGGGSPAEADSATYQEAAVQSCMEEAGLRYDIVPDTEPPPAAPTITKTSLIEEVSTHEMHHDVLETATEELGWLGYRQAIEEGPTTVPLDQEWHGAPQDHLWAEWERQAIERSDGGDSELDSYVQQLTFCQEEVYDIDMLDLEQRRLLEQVLTTDWTAAKTTGFLARDERVRAAQQQRQDCHADMREEELGQELDERLDRIAEEAGYSSPNQADPHPQLDPGESGWGERYLLDVDPADVPGLEEFIEDTREPTLQLIECERRYAQVVADVADERAGEYLRSRAPELREAGIEVDLEHD